MRPAPPFTNHRFRVEIEGIEASGALEVTLPEARIGAGSRSSPRLVCGALTVRRGQTRSSAWYDWWDETRSSKGRKGRTISVVLLDAEGADALRWKYAGALPIAYRVSALNALESSLLVESLEIAVKGFDASFGAVKAVLGKHQRPASRPAGRGDSSGSVD